MSSGCHQNPYWTGLVAPVYDRRAQQYRPAGAALEQEIRRLHATGLSALDVATALRLAPDHVHNVIAEGTAMRSAPRKVSA